VAQQQQSAATAPTNSDLSRPAKASDQLQRPLSTSMRLVCIQNVSKSPAAAANGSNRIVLGWSQPTSIDPLTCIDNLY
jgi:hypothetical protein